MSNVRYLPDLPVENDQELWSEVEALAHQLARELPAIPPTSPVLLSGDWGSGKTTLLKAIQRKLESNKSQEGIKPLRTIFFEAWRYEGAGLLLPALLRAIWERLLEGERPDVSAQEKLWHYAVVVSVGMAGSLAKMAGGAASPLMDALLALLADKKKGGPAAFLKPPEDAVLELQKSFHALLEKAGTPDEPVVIMIDDLDRCSPAGAVVLLDAIRHLVNQAAPMPGKEQKPLPCRFVVALDRRVLSQAVGSKFANVSPYDSNRYLKKLFPIVFDVPRPNESQVGRLVSLFLGPGSQGKGSGLDSNDADALATALSEPIFANPRLMKRCINRFYLVRSFEGGQSQTGLRRVGEQTPQEGDHLKDLARWIAATELWPSVRELLVRKPREAWVAALAAGTGEGPAVDSELAVLFEEEGANDWFKRHLGQSGKDRLKDFLQADRRLRRWGL